MREKLALLVNKIRGSEDAHVKEKHPEYYGLENVVTDEMAEVALAMDMRHYLPVAEIASRLNMEEAYVHEQLKELEYVGIVESRVRDGKDEFTLIIYVPGVYELMVMNKKQTEDHPEIARAFDEYTLIRMGKLVPNLPRGTGPMRVIPVATAIDGEQRRASYEEIEYWLDKYDPSIGVGDCECRVVRRLAGEGCGHLEKDMCIGLGDTAESCIRTGKLRRITKQEALDIIKHAEECGLMHQVTNIDGNDKIFGICNCCECSCLALRTDKYFNTPNSSNCNYVAETKPENCVACGQCVETCPANALKLGQKLCTKTPIEQKKRILPDDHEWDRDMWNPEYRENREDTVVTGTAPCKAACPAHIAVQGYIQMAKEGKYLEALELIKKENPFPAVCGRICPHNCENECSRGEFDAPVAIDDIKRFIADFDLNEKERFVPKKLHDYYDHKIAVIGSGPAGLSCAYYLATFGYDVTVFEKEQKLGGMMTLGIPSFRLEKNVVEAEIDVLRQMGVKFKTGYEVGRDIQLKKLRAEGYKGFYVAIGAQGGRRLGLDGEDAEGVVAGVDFLKGVNLGSGLQLHGNVVVIGGGNVAIDVARTAVRQGAGKVSMYCLEKSEEMPALPEEQDEARGEGVEIDNSWGPNRIIVDNGRVTGVEFKRCTAVFDAGHKFAPQYDVCDLKQVPADFVLMSVGQSIEWGNLLYRSRVELGRGNTAVADPLTYQTAEPDVFVGGDVYTGPKFAIDAIAAGKEGAISLHRYVWEGQSLTIGRDRRNFPELDKTNIDKDAVEQGWDNTPRQKPTHKAENEKTYKDTRATLTAEQVKKEAARCLGCGKVVLDQDECIGCGLCTTRCKFDAIHLVKKYDTDQCLTEDLPMLAMARYGERMDAIAAREAAEAEAKK